MLIDLPQNVLKAMLMFASPLDILRLRKVCFHLFNFIKVCRRQLPMPEMEALIILAPSTDDSDLWKFIVKYPVAEPDEQGSVGRKIHGINSLNLSIKENFWLGFCWHRRRSRLVSDYCFLFLYLLQFFIPTGRTSFILSCRSYTVPTSRLNEMVQELCQFRHSLLHIGQFNGRKSIWTNLGSLLQMLNDFYGECPTLRPGNVYFQYVDLTTVAMVDWRTFLAKMNTQGNKRSFQVSTANIKFCMVISPFDF